MQLLVMGKFSSYHECGEHWNQTGFCKTKYILSNNNKNTSEIIISFQIISYVHKIEMRCSMEKNTTVSMSKRQTLQVVL